MKKFFLILALLFLSVPCFAVFCINCGKDLPDQAKFCSECGKPTNLSPEGAAGSDTASIAVPSDSMLVRICFTTLDREKLDRLLKMFRLTEDPLVKIGEKEFVAARKDALSGVFDFVLPKDIAGKELQVSFSADRRKWTVFNYGQWSNKRIELKKKLSPETTGDLFFIRAFYVEGLSGDAVSFHINTPDQVEEIAREMEMSQQVSASIKNFYKEQELIAERLKRERAEQEKIQILGNINDNLSDINRKMGY